MEKSKRKRSVTEVARCLVRTRNRSYPQDEATNKAWKEFLWTGWKMNTRGKNGRWLHSDISSPDDFLIPLASWLFKNRAKFRCLSNERLYRKVRNKYIGLCKQLKIEEARTIGLIENGIEVRSEDPEIGENSEHW